MFVSPWFCSYVVAPEQPLFLAIFLLPRLWRAFISIKGLQPAFVYSVLRLQISIQYFVVVFFVSYSVPFVGSVLKHDLFRNF